MDKKESDVHFVKVLKQRGMVSILFKINLSSVSSVLRVKRPLLFPRELIGSTFVIRKKLFFKQLKMLLMEPAFIMWQISIRSRLPQSISGFSLWAPDVKVRFKLSKNLVQSILAS